MKTYSRLTLALLLLILVVPQVGASQSLFNIRLNLQPGDNFTSSSRITTSLTLTDTSLDQTMGFTTSYKVVGVENSGDIKIQYASEAFVYRKSDHLGNVFEYNSKQPIGLEHLELTEKIMVASMLPMLGKTCTIILSPEGKVLRAEGVKDMLREAQVEGAKIVAEIFKGIENTAVKSILLERLKKVNEQMLSEESVKRTAGQTFNYLPPKAVQIGDSWSKDFAIPVYGGSGQTDVSWTLISATPNFLTLKIYSKSSTNNHTSAMQVPSYGIIIVDRKSGLAVRHASVGVGEITFKGRPGVTTIRADGQGTFSNSCHLKAYDFIVPHPDGSKYQGGSFLNGVRNGLWTEWDENGNKTKEIQYKDGKEISRKEF